MAKKKKKKFVKRQTDKTRTMAIIGLLLNILILPGVGTLIAGKTKEGIWQIVLSVIGLIFYFATFGLFRIGVVFLFVAWIWGLISGVKLIEKYKG
ncbi:hypothetical protein HYV50_03320 [Candidatus Pacearchaeota archaeon]|nr:hypothetical protein [Candidatus Pacearchaeota archaeon]